MKRALTLLCALVFLAGCDRPPIGERAVTQGTNPAFSPDGSRLAFQRLDGDVFKIGVTGVKGGAVEWIEEGPGNAAYPEWTPAMVGMCLIRVSFAGTTTSTCHLSLPLVTDTWGRSSLSRTAEHS